MILESEHKLDDDYPVFPCYWYLANGEPIESPVQGNVRRLRAALDLPETTEIRRCDAVARRLPLI